MEQFVERRSIRSRLKDVQSDQKTLIWHAMKDVNGAVIRSVSRGFNGGVTHKIKNIMSAIISLNRALSQ
jgi:hypothetical protein